jgi:hypothetical protein
MTKYAIRFAGAATASFLVGAMLVGTLSASAQQADTFSARVRDMCTPDAVKLCPDHKLGSEAMRYCMEAKFKSISKDCIVALQDDGLLPRNIKIGENQR